MNAPKVVLELRCRMCEGALFTRHSDGGDWVCTSCGSEAVVLVPPYPPRPAAARRGSRSGAHTRGRGARRGS